MNTTSIIVYFVLLIAPIVSNAGDFINLGFEHPDLSHIRPSDFPDVSIAPTSEALQGWTLTGLAPSQLTSMYIALSTPPVSLRPAFTPSGSSVDFGKYALYLDSPSLAPGSLQPIYHLSQSGIIPVGSTELVFSRYGPSPTINPFQILINGQSVAYIEAGVGFANVSGFAGQQVSLEFVFPKGGSIFDIAGFTIAPEPSTYALFGLGAALLWWQHRRRKS